MAKSIINIVNISKRFIDRVLLDNVNLLIEEKSKIGMIGRNGAGKTTLLKILMGLEEADDGEIIFSDDVRIGYLRQQGDFDESEKAIDYLVMVSGKESWKCSKIASRFGIDHIKVNYNIGSLSSGYRMRVKLAEMMLEEPNFLILDEPSNFLDLNTLIDLENFLMDYNGGFLIVSHDREFLKTTCEKTVEIEKGKLTYFPGNIEDYFEYKEEKEYTIKKYNKNVEERKAHLERFVERFRYKASKAKAVQSRIKQIEKLKTIEINHPAKSVRIRLPEVESKKGFAIISDDLSVGYGEKVVVTSRRMEIPRGSRVAVLGENGEGKTTFLRTIAGRLKPVSGSYNYSYGIKLAYFGEDTYKNITANDNVLSYLKKNAKQGLLTQELLTLLGSFLFSGEDVNKDVKVLSGGEMARLSLLCAITQCADVLILDEPTNHLDFETVEALANSLRDYGGTIFFTSHDRTFASLLADTIIEVKDKKLSLYNGDYEAYVYKVRLEALEEEERELEYQEANNTKEINTIEKNNSNYEERKKIRNRLSKAESMLKKYEKEIEDYKKEEIDILKFFEKDYNDDKSKRLLEVKKLIEEKENEWLLINEEIDSIKAMLE
ncbi:ABC-F family ATP-binding cassette domain-containing protein [Brachyspira pilosicoli]|uniref:ATP-binding cassette domain-containing protein n=1 Tax=Brachyspira pilosicoli TaxID=52584 RepID=A0A5C8F6B7_BRAPL|nr:ABC-F family ATP-binding cassette domain-containing protein [Brachyspira pilosicoli]TXJ44681.1 ATP-binding cassette domain-containing protein [Brachyspira pilosicoli]